MINATVIMANIERAIKCAATRDRRDGHAGSLRARQLAAGAR